MKAIGFLLTGLLLLTSTAGASANDVEAFYKGKTVTLHIGFGVGGGYDIYGRMASRHLSRFLPGSPTVIVRNLPSAGSLLLANQMANTLPQDGTAIGIIGNSLVLEQMLGTPQVMFDVGKFNWIGRFDDLALLLLAWNASGIATIDDVLSKEFSIGVPGRGSSGEFSLNAIKKLLGTKFKLISGYKTGVETKLAMERGEVDATASVQWSTVKVANRDWLEQKKVNMLVVLGLDRFPDLPNTPTAPELAKTSEQRRILELLMAPAQIGRALMAPPNVPADRLAALRSAFDKMTADPGFLADAAKQHQTINPLAASGLQQMTDEISRTEPSIIERFKVIARP